MSIAPLGAGGASPFDQIRRTRPDGSEYWSARDLMPLLGYDKWERFESSIERAIVSMNNQPGHGCEFGEHNASRRWEASGKVINLIDAITSITPITGSISPRARLTFRYPGMFLAHAVRLRRISSCHASPRISLQ